MLPAMKGPLEPPTIPFASSKSPSRSTSISGKNGADSSSISLTVNYQPSKFSNSLLSPGGSRRRKGGKGDLVVPKLGGGVDAFKSGEARIPGQNDEDYDGVSGGWFGGNSAPKKLRWNKFKWILFVANCIVSSLWLYLTYPILIFSLFHSLHRTRWSPSFFVFLLGLTYGIMLTSSESAIVLNLLLLHSRPP